MISIIVAVLLTVTMTACDSGKSSPGASRTAGSTSPASLTPAAAAERDALAAYRGMWDAWVEAGKTSNPDEPALRTHISGEALKLIVKALVTNQHNQHVSLGNVVLDPKVTEVKPPEAPTVATVKDCVNTENWLNYKASGGLVDNVPGGRRVMTATVSAADGAWKVSAFQLGRVGTC
jgi:hypothetical protein